MLFVEVLLAVLVEVLLTVFFLGCAVVSGVILVLGPHGAGWPLSHPRSGDRRRPS